MTAADFMQQLRDPGTSIGSLIFNTGAGYVDPPGFGGSPARRWTWIADLLDHPEWGIVGDLPNLAVLCNEAARLCRLSAEPVHSVALAGQWAALAAAVDAAGRAHRGAGEAEALDMLADLAVDGVDYCGGIDLSGFEVLLGYAHTVLQIRAATAREALLRAAAAWAAEDTTAAGLQAAS